jgi:AbrB family looped-hinge helix DNA binding protein
METARVSSEGNITLPKTICESRGWSPGTELTVEETGEGVLLRPARHFPRTTLADLDAFPRYEGEPKTVEEMDEGIAREIRRRHERGRY